MDTFFSFHLDQYFNIHSSPLHSEIASHQLQNLNCVNSAFFPPLLFYLPHIVFLVEPDVFLPYSVIFKSQSILLIWEGPDAYQEFPTELQSKLWV